MYCTPYQFEKSKGQNTDMYSIFSFLNSSKSSAYNFFYLNKVLDAYCMPFNAVFNSNSEDFY